MAKAGRGANTATQGFKPKDTTSREIVKAVEDINESKIKLFEAERTLEETKKIQETLLGNEILIIKDLKDLKEKVKKNADLEKKIQENESELAKIKTSLKKAETDITEQQKQISQFKDKIDTLTKKKRCQTGGK